MDAITKTSGPCVILAGAGTGKTYTIVEKVRYIAENKIYPINKVVCITFSNEATKNLSSRIQKTLSEIGFGLESQPIVRTFHGFFADLLREYGKRIGLNREFKILDPDQAKIVLHRNFRVPVMNCHKYVSTIGISKDLGIIIEEFQEYIRKKTREYDEIELEKRLENLNFELQTLHITKQWNKKKELAKEIKKLRKIIEIKKFVSTWGAYEKIKQKNNYLDYSDLNKYALELVEKFPEIGNNYDYIIVDEFQDTNKLQLDFLIAFSRNRNITVVGDMNQSIYRFRGAYKENLNTFRKAFDVKETDIFTLSKSYRSPNKILRVAHKLISKNYFDENECFFVENIHSREGQAVEIYELKNAKEEARKIVEIIKEENKRGVQDEEICIMFRAHQHQRVIRKVLEDEGIKYVSVDKPSLLKQKSIRTCLDYLRILNALKTEKEGQAQSWWDLAYNLKFQPSDLTLIGKTIKDFSGNKRTGGKKQENQKNETLSFYLVNNLDKIGLSEQGKVAARILIDKIKSMLCFVEGSVAELVSEIYRISGLIPEQKTSEEKETILNLNKFYEQAKLYEELYDSDLGNFLYYIDMLQSLGIEIEAAQLEEKGVRLMTCHSTKGLEYNTVIVTNFSQGRFPIEAHTNNFLIPTELLPEVREEISSLDEDSREDYIINFEKRNQLLEERRLAYVSFTRAKERLIITFADSYGNKNFLPSQFLDEIEYKANNDLMFQSDLEEKYVARAPEIRSDIGFLGAIGTDGFCGKADEISLDLVKTTENNDQKKLSPSALNLFEKCQKEFEYKYVLNMPERKTISWEAIRFGSFAHLVFQVGVSSCFKTLEEFLILAKQYLMEEEWEGIEFGEVETLIRVFFERHKNRYSEKSKTEQYLSMEIDGIEFLGFADRIDFTDKGVEIVDYKTGKMDIPKRERNLQLGFYVLAAQERYGRVSRVILDMLKQERPLEFEIDSKGNAHCLSSKFVEGFNIYHIKEEIIKTASMIREAYKKGFRPCPIERNCEFCNEYIYGI